MDDDPNTRPYKKRKRARQEEETRLRITEAVVELHRTVGPAATTVTDVAERAGVSRMTVYNHFPTETDLIEACSSHWSAQNPPPDPAEWAVEVNPERRVLTALGILYAWYADKRDMMEKVLRDAPLVAPLGQIMDARWGGYIDLVVETLMPGWDEGEATASERRAALAVAVDFPTWRTLVDRGFTDADAADLMTRMVVGGLAPGER